MKAHFRLTQLKGRRRWVVIVCATLILASALAAAIGVFLARKPDGTAFVLKGAVPAAPEPFASALYQSVGVRMAPGHEVKWLDNGAVFGALVEDIGRAQRSVHIVMYIWERGAASDQIVPALVAKAKAGVACRLLIDAFGSPDFEKEIAPTLRAAGCDVRMFRPVLERSRKRDELARNHRKIAVIDGTVAVTGGFGVRDDWLGDGVSHGSWRDANARFTGPAVHGAQQAFAENWSEAGGDFLPPDAFPTPAAAGTTTGPAHAAFVTTTGSPVVTRGERLSQLMIGAATKRLWIENAYFVPSPAIVELLAAKAASGVDVRILTPGKKSDSKTAFGAQHVHFGTLAKRGARVWQYEPSMMHAKTILVDDDLALVGSINLEPLSLNMLDDAALVVRDRAFAAELAARFEADCTHGKELPR